MAFITSDYKNNTSNDYSPLPTGEYEMVINHAAERATQNGAESLQIDFIVRNDLDAAEPDTNAKYHNRHLFMDNWKRKATGAYDMDGLQYILEAAQIPEGTQLNSIQDFCDALYRKPVRVYTKVSKEEYNGETQERNQIAPWNVHVSKYPQVQHQFKTEDGKPAASGDGKPIEIGDDDLPF